ncbi:hypothetical protein GCM10010448_11800 [Streptomyces glomeratus]|uniref:Uncharacterized protein n=1 Tax=Streptomyces glomeratus TaxID=284452 RepID=A0ABP6L381_9ACTN
MGETHVFLNVYGALGMLPGLYRHAVPAQQPGLRPIPVRRRSGKQREERAAETKANETKPLIATWNPWLRRT